jgi:hypothetical protein
MHASDCDRKARRKENAAWNDPESGSHWRKHDFVYGFVYALVPCLEAVLGIYET